MPCRCCLSGWKIPCEAEPPLAARGTRSSTTTPISPGADSSIALNGELAKSRPWASAPWTGPQVDDTEAPEVALFTLDAGGDPKAVVRGATQLRGIAGTLRAAFSIDPRS